MKKNFIYNLIYQILILIIPLITIPYVSRVLGAEGIGVYSYTYSIVYYFMLVAMLGINNYGNRTIAKIRDNKEELSKNFLGIYIVQLITAFIMSVTYLIYIFVFDNQYREIALIQTIYIFSAMFDVNWFFFGIEKFKLTITRNSIVKILSLILIFLFVKEKNDIYIYTLILAGSTLLSNVFLISFIRKYIHFTKLIKKDIIKHIKPCIVMFLPVIAVSIYKIMDKIMLGAISNMTEVGYYENAEKTTQIPLVIITALGTVMLPRASKMLSNGEEETLKVLIGKSMKFVMFLVFPIMLGIICISKDFSILFFGSEFEKSGILIQYLAITILFLSFGNVIRTQYLIPKEKDKEYIISPLLGAVVNLILNFIFIPMYGALGACYGTVLAEFVVVFYQTMKVRKELRIIKYIKDAIPFLIKALIMFVVIISFNKLGISSIEKIIIQIVVGTLLYIILNIKYINQTIGIKRLFHKYIKKEV